MHNAPKEWIYDSTKDGTWHHHNRKAPKEWISDGTWHYHICTGPNFKEPDT
jgi:hypothetical protein